MTNPSAGGKWGRVWRYEGPRGVVWRIRYRDASGRRVLETLGKEPAWNRKRGRAPPPAGRRRARGVPKAREAHLRRLRRALARRVPSRPRPQANDGEQLHG